MSLIKHNVSRNAPADGSGTKAAITTLSTNVDGNFDEMEVHFLRLNPF